MKPNLNTFELLNLINLLTKEKNTTKFLEIILDTAMKITNSDAGSIYKVIDNKQLRFEIIKTKSLNIHCGGTSNEPLFFDEIPLYDKSNPVLTKVVTYCYHTQKTINIQNVDEDHDGIFIDTKYADKKIGYKTIALLTVPICNHENEIVSILQLINPLDSTSKIINYDVNDEKIVESLCSLAASALTQKQLIQRLEQLFESFIKLINKAIDDKSPYTGKHCSRVPILTELIALSLHESDHNPFSQFTLSEKDKYELKIASLLHDCGKISTPIHVVDKATKLECILDRIELISLRFEIIKKDLELQLLKNEINQTQYQHSIEDIKQSYQFLKDINFGSESMNNEDILRLNSIAKRYALEIDGKIISAISQDELYNLEIKRGTLNDSDRHIINRHIDTTIEMLEALPWPKHLKNVPEYAGGHHEKMDGSGYPRGLHKNELSIQARCLAIADIFEALTAKDRPYKKGKTLSESLTILGKMKLNNHIDPDIFNVFIWDKVYERYAEQFLDPEQIDQVNLYEIPGYESPPINQTINN
jgi:HD-GYP domain-containing protein (c-di-GMP phosphodiesterase class II)